MNGPLRTTREVADRLGVTPETVLRWIETRGLPVIRLTSRALRYEDGAIDAWIIEHTAASGRGSANHPDRRRHAEANLLGANHPAATAAQDEEE